MGTASRIPGVAVIELVVNGETGLCADLNPGEKRFVRYSVTYKRRKVGPELNTEKKREPL